MNKTPSLLRKPPAPRNLIKRVHILALLTATLAGLFPAPCRAESVVVQWEKIYNGPGNGEDRLIAMAVDSGDNVIVTGYSRSGARNFDYYTAKYAAADGALLWENRYNGPSNDVDVATAMVVDSAGNAIVTGGSRGSRGWEDWYTAKYAAASGVLLWGVRYNGPADGPDYAEAVTVDRDGNVIVVGSIAVAESAPSAFKKDFYTAKYAAADGALLWANRYNGPGINDKASEVEVDSAGNVTVTGTVNVTGTVDLSGAGNDIYTAKYAAANGALLWDKRYNGPANGYDGPSALAVDSAGNVNLTGTVTVSGGGTDIYTAKYAAANGALLWDKRYNGPANGDDGGTAVAVDSEGNAIVTGASRGSGGSSDIYRVKYAAADGALIWEKRYNFSGTPLDVAVDGAGNVFVTGYFYSSGGNHDIYTAKYAEADGLLLWEMRYNGAGNLNDYGDSVTVDSAGKVIVTGRTTNSSGNLDFYTVKYAPVDLDLDNDGLLDSWEVAHFGNITEHSALDDTDGDGRVELLELAFGADPLAPDAGATPAVIVEGAYLTTTITKHPGATYVVQTGPALDAGFSAASTTVLTDNATTLKVRDNVPVGTQPARFLRVQVTAAP